jgi:hypothetical protein
MPRITHRDHVSHYMGQYEATGGHQVQGLDQLARLVAVGTDEVALPHHHRHQVAGHDLAAADTDGHGDATGIETAHRELDGLRAADELQHGVHATAGRDLGQCRLGGVQGEVGA